MNVLKKYTWLVGTLMRAGDKGLTLEQIGDRWNATRSCMRRALSRGAPFTQTKDPLPWQHR